MYYVITPNKVYFRKEVKDFDKIGLKVDLDEFKPVGGDFVAKLTTQDLDFVIDKHKISRLALGNLYNTAQQKTSNLFLYIIIALQLIAIIKK